MSSPRHIALSQLGSSGFADSRSGIIADQVMRLLWRTGRISRSELARQSGFSRSTISEVVGRLLQTGYVEEVGLADSSGGRPAVVLQFQDAHRVFLGVDLGATHVSLVLIDLRGRVMGSVMEDYPVRTDPTGAVARVTSMAREILQTVGFGEDRLMGIGLGTPGPVDASARGFMSPVILPSWTGLNIPEALGQGFRVPVYVDNDANLGALADLWWGVGCGYQNFAYLKVGHGIGAGFVLDGHLYRGARGMAGEFGHLSIDPAGPVCRCGLRGCLVTYIGGSALVGQALAWRSRFPESDLARGEMTLEAIQRASATEDPLGLALAGYVARHLGRALAGWVNLMDPELVVLGGSVIRMGGPVVDLLYRELDQCALTPARDRIEIRLTQLGPPAIALGAATLALDKSISRPEFYLETGLA